ncbi:hypothetical protein H257_15668 [Aphanomyces astaci]|uniref:Uncharacterized protein n=1 Tax=Aphanomyces astaci TaxID=112090 RepID=W4FLI4_APHAT|nr:hypothetical protein H257_15668 [Aphanomyces astaci]ETV68345.1 hypothetical protein H257_15668 [Aphanomyces astaci]|eukprot:XP_009842140.1 hypothetical protein H257_15668 [Aphanomyces astaci]
MKSYSNNLAPPPVVEEGGGHGLMVCTQEALVFKMAFFINDTASFFAFVSAMRPLQVLGPLDRYVMPLYTLRPELTMKQDLNNMDESSRLHLRDIAKYVTQVTVVDWTDLAWLHHHYEQWRLLRITRVIASYIDLADQFPSSLAPHLSHLTSLTLTLTAAPVEHLYFRNWKLQDLDNVALKQAIYAAVFNCPTLKALAYEEFMANLQSLTLVAGKLNTRSIQALAGKFPMSPMSQLTLHNPGDKDNRGLECLLQALLTP